MLPVDHPGVDVAPLHPHDCYVIQQADGIAYFGELPASATALQRQLTKPIAHRVETREDHPECALDACLRVAEVAEAIQHELTTGQNARWLRVAVGPALSILLDDPTRAMAARRVGLHLHPYTVRATRVPERFPDATAYMSYLFEDLGATGVFTDNPDLFPRVVDLRAVKD